jgi:DNA-binding transcriptional LysR family regulator
VGRPEVGELGEQIVVGAYPVLRHLPICEDSQEVILDVVGECPAIFRAGYTGMSQYKSAPRFHEQHLQKEKLLWVQAEDSKIDPKKDPLPLVMFGPKCRFRPLCLDALQKAGRTWEIVYDGGSIQAIQSAVEAGLGLSVITPISLKPGIEIVGEKAGLPPLPPVNSHSIIEKISPSRRCKSWPTLSSSR